MVRAWSFVLQVMEENVAMAAELEACHQRIKSLGSEMESKGAAAIKQQEEAVQALAAKHASEVRACAHHEAKVCCHDMWRTSSLERENRRENMSMVVTPHKG
eukprot:scaffold76486_cov21-Tisochrysis_lutea.AAC.2